MTPSSGTESYLGIQKIGFVLHKISIWYLVFWAQKPIIGRFLGIFRLFKKICKINYFFG